MIFFAQSLSLSAPNGSADDVPNSFSVVVFILLHLHKVFKSFIAEKFFARSFFALKMFIIYRACKKAPPEGNAHAMTRPISRVLSCAIIYLGDPSPERSSRHYTPFHRADVERRYQ